ncbi:hypothetical protein AGMMS50233_00040 [Endomicrobiia bacterium]|nr:hypothetical protein AGMMS50233_00040 [Endomicrobiia bacterium]
MSSGEYALDGKKGLLRKVRSSSDYARIDTKTSKTAKQEEKKTTITVGSS